MAYFNSPYFQIEFVKSEQAGPPMRDVGFDECEPAVFHCPPTEMRDVVEVTTEERTNTLKWKCNCLARPSELQLAARARSCSYRDANTFSRISSHEASSGSGPPISYRASDRAILKTSASFKGGRHRRLFASINPS